MTRVRYGDLTADEINLLKRHGVLNGCGPKLGWVNYLVPDVIFGLHVEEDCQHHDFNYWLGGSEADRIKADWQFYEEIKKRAQAKTRPWWKRWLRPIYYSAAWSYHRGVRMFGARFGGFYYATNERTREDLIPVLAACRESEEELRDLL